VLDSVLGKLARQHDPNVLVGFETADDAGVYQLTPELALVQTVDFFTPIVDDPYVFGQIAATNALSDIYAMGGQPLSALALVCFPDDGEFKTLEEMLSGGLSKMVEANCTVIGGHSIRDDELKLGYAVTGTVHPQRVLANGGAKIGDRLILTKHIGTGVISTAIKRGKANFTWVRDAVRSMTTLNRSAAEVITNGFEVHALTDVTGFGLLGHAREMANASGVSLQIHAGQVPFLHGALQCVRAGLVPGGLKANRNFAESCVQFAGDVPEEIRALLFDPQTAGGLLIALRADDAVRVVSHLGNAGVAAVEIGEVVARQKTLIIVAW
jgi:selenide, water dikinase